MFKFLSKTLMIVALVVPTAAFLGADESDINDATSAVLHASSAAPKVAALRHVPSVGAIDVDPSGASPSSDVGGQLYSLAIIAERNTAGIARLRHALAGNPVTRNALASNGVNIGRVVGVEIGATGALRVFTD